MENNLYALLLEKGLIIDRSLYIAKIDSDDVNAKYALGIPSSKLLSWLFRYERNGFDDLFAKIRMSEFRKLPLKIIEDQTPLINKVDQILTAKKEDSEADTSDLEEESV